MIHLHLNLDNPAPSARRFPTHTCRLSAAVATVLLFGSTVVATQGGDRARTESQARRANERLVTLQHEADTLARQQRSLLGDLRRLEVERDLKTEQLKQIDLDTQKLSRALGNTGNQIAELEEKTAAARPLLDARMVEVYKLGGAGYVRLLFNVSDLKEVGRAYRMVAAVAAIDRHRAEEHRLNLIRLRDAQAMLERRRLEMAKLKQAAVLARAAADRAAQSRTQLIAEIDRRRDLTAELAGELQSAQQKLQQTLAAMNSGTPRAVAEGISLPIRPFRGDLEWPVSGRMLTRFGMGGATVSRAPGQAGVQLAVDEGSPVRAVHEGTVAFAGPFTGYGNLVIIDHGAATFSLYGQLAAPQVEQGARVDRGQSVGTVGRILAGIPGVYFELRVDGKPVDPLEWLKKKP